MTLSLFHHRPKIDPFCARILSFLDLDSLDAAWHRNEAAIKELLSYRACPIAKNQHNETYLDIFNNPDRPLPRLPDPKTKPSSTICIIL